MEGFGLKSAFFFQNLISELQAGDEKQGHGAKPGKDAETDLPPEF